MAEKLAMTHGELSDALVLSENFFEMQGQSPETTIVAPLAELSKRLQNVDGYMGLLGVGYPFYAKSAVHIQTEPVPSIKTYLQETRSRVQQSADKHGEAWPCAECQVANKLPNLTDQCAPCKRVTFKPRDLFRALPDMDALAVFRKTSDEVEADVQAILLDMGWIRFNTDIKGAYEATVAALSGDTNTRLPIDFHILTLDQLTSAFQKLSADALGVQIGVRSRAWRAHWKDQPVDISYSFPFSMTEIGELQPGMYTLLTQTRKEIITNYAVEDIVSMVARSRRCGPIIGDVSLRSVLRERIQSWAQIQT